MENKTKVVDNDLTEDQSDADFIMSLFEDGDMPVLATHQAAIPDYYQEDMA